MPRDDAPTPWTRQLLVGIVALVVVALVVGGVVSVLALGAARVSGLGSSRPATTSRPGLVIPTGRPTTRIDEYPAPTASPRARATRSTPAPAAAPQQRAVAISLQAFPQNVGAGQRINLTGLYQGGEGARLQVQRFDAGSWVDFPVSTTVSGGQFATYITTSHTGLNRLRVVDKAAAPGRRLSNVVRVTVG